MKLSTTIFDTKKLFGAAAWLTTIVAIALLLDARHGIEHAYHKVAEVGTSATLNFVTGTSSSHARRHGIGKKNEVDSSNTLTVHLLTGITTDHWREHIEMLGSLALVNYTGIITIYAMFKSGEDFNSTFLDYRKQIQDVGLNWTLVPFELMTPTSYYCFKPRIVQDFLVRSGPIDVLMWTDASSRFLGNPSLWAQKMVRNDIHFAGRLGVLGMGEGTDPRMYDYFNIDRTTQFHFVEVASGHFLINLRSPAKEFILQKWLVCGNRACTTCMAPLNSTKRLSGTPKGRNATVYIGHRQDQSALSVLAYEWFARGGRIAVNDAQYLYIKTERNYRPWTLENLREGKITNRYQPNSRLGPASGQV